MKNRGFALGLIQVFMLDLYGFVLVQLKVYTGFRVSFQMTAMLP